jgi:hypothetical protein
VGQDGIGNKNNGAEGGQGDKYEDVAASCRLEAVFSGEDRIQLSGPADMECAGLPISGRSIAR